MGLFNLGESMTAYAGRIAPHMNGYLPRSGSGLRPLPRIGGGMGGMGQLSLALPAKFPEKVPDEFRSYQRGCQGPALQNAQSNLSKISSSLRTTSAAAVSLRRKVEELRDAYDRGTREVQGLVQQPVAIAMKSDLERAAEVLNSGYRTVEGILGELQAHMSTEAKMGNCPLAYDFYMTPTPNRVQQEFRPGLKAISDSFDQVRSALVEVKGRYDRALRDARAAQREQQQAAAAAQEAAEAAAQAEREAAAQQAAAAQAAAEAEAEAARAAAELEAKIAEQQAKVEQQRLEQLAVQQQAAQQQQVAVIESQQQARQAEFDFAAQQAQLQIQLEQQRLEREAAREAQMLELELQRLAREEEREARREEENREMRQFQLVLELAKSGFLPKEAVAAALPGPDITLPPGVQLPGGQPGIPGGQPGIPGGLPPLPPGYAYVQDTPGAGYPGAGIPGYPGAPAAYPGAPVGYPGGFPTQGYPGAYAPPGIPQPQVVQPAIQPTAPNQAYMPPGGAGSGAFQPGAEMFGMGQGGGSRTAKELSAEINANLGKKAFNPAAYDLPRARQPEGAVVASGYLVYGPDERDNYLIVNPGGQAFVTSGSSIASGRTLSDPSVGQYRGREFLRATGATSSADQRSSASIVNEWLDTLGSGADQAISAFMRLEGREPERGDASRLLALQAEQRAQGLQTALYVGGALAAGYAIYSFVKK